MIKNKKHRYEEALLNNKPSSDENIIQILKDEALKKLLEIEKQVVSANDPDKKNYLNNLKKLLTR